MIRIKLMDDSFQEIRREEIIHLAPANGLFRHPQLSFDALAYFSGRIVPVSGPLPADKAAKLPAEERPWLLLFRDHAQVIKGLPEFDDEVELTKPVPKIPAQISILPQAILSAEPEEVADEEEAKLIQEMEELLKSA